MSSSEDKNEGRCPFDENVSILRGSPFFSGLPMDTLKALAYVCKRVKYREGDAIFTRDEMDDKAYALLEGRAELVLERDGAETVLGELTQGAFIGAMALVADVPRLFTLRAATPVKMLVLPRKKFFTDKTVCEETARGFLKAVVRGVVQWEAAALERGRCPAADLGDAGVSLI